MTHTLRTLSELSMTTIHQAFMAAFADYIQDPSGVTEDIFTNRAHNNGVDLNLSAGAFVEDELVGFTLVATGEYSGRQSAYDAGTGVIQERRGVGIAKEMFDFLASRLKDRGIEVFYLEALTQNDSAIRAYKKAGFEVSRVLDSFVMDLQNNLPTVHPLPDLAIHTVQIVDLHLYDRFLDWEPSWENRFATIERITNGVILLGALYRGERAGILVYYPMLHWILCLAVKPEYRRLGIGSRLVAALPQYLPEEATRVRMINVDHEDQGMIRFLEKTGFEYTFNQFEMVKGLSEPVKNMD